MLVGILGYALVVPEAPVHCATGEATPVGEVLRQPRVQALLAACFGHVGGAWRALHLLFDSFTARGYGNTLIGALRRWACWRRSWCSCSCRAMRRYSLRFILLASFVAAVVRFSMIGWGVESLAVIFVAQLLHGLTFGAYHAASIAAVNRWFAGRCQARGQPGSRSSFGAGGLLGGCSGWSWDALGGHIIQAP